MAVVDVAVVLSGLRDYEIYERTRGQIRSQWFPTQDLRAVWEAIKGHHEAHPGKKLTWKDLKVLMRGKKGFGKLDELHKRSEGISKGVYLKSLSSFLEQQMTEDLAQDIARCHESGQKINHDDYIRRLEAAKRAGTLSVDRRKLFEEEPKNWIQKIENVPVIPLPSFELTAALRGGIAGGRPTTVLTRTDGGKTSFAVACGAFAVRKGFKVLHCTLEDSADEVFRRYSCAFTGQTWDWVHLHPKTTQKKLTEVKKNGGDLEVADFSSLETGIADIEMAAARAKRGWGGLDFIIVDAGDDISTKDGTELKTEIIGKVWASLTRLSRKYNDVPVMVTTQTNRLGAGANQILLTHVSEGWKKATVSSVVLVFDVPKDSKRGRVCIVKTKRKGYYPEIPVWFDRERCIVR